MTKNDLDYSLFSRRRTAFMGIAAILTIIWHTYCASDFRSLGLLGIPAYFGACGVNIFVLVSGLGCYYSFSRGGNVRRFMRKRLMTVLPVSLLLVGAFAAAEILLKLKTPGTALTDCLSPGSDNPAWYVPFSLISYLVFPFLFHLVRRASVMAVIGVILLLIAVTFVLAAADYERYVSVEATVTRLPLFLFGGLCGRFAMEKRKIRHLWILLPAIPALLAAGYLISREAFSIALRYASCLAGVLICPLTALLSARIGVFRGKAALRKFFEFFGMMSLELYLTHNLAKSLFQENGTLTLLVYAAVAAGSILLSVPLSKLRRSILNAAETNTTAKM